MSEHFHLLISEPERANPSVVIQALKLGGRGAFWLGGSREGGGTESSHPCGKIVRVIASGRRGSMTTTRS